MDIKHCDSAPHHNFLIIGTRIKYDNRLGGTIHYDEYRCSHCLQIEFIKQIPEDDDNFGRRINQ